MSAYRRSPISRQPLSTGGPCNAYELRLETDFFDESIRELILKDATVILINNLVFPDDLNEKLKGLIGNMADGTRIVTAKELSSRLQTVNGRNAKGNSVACRLLDYGKCLRSTA